MLIFITDFICVLRIILALFSLHCTRILDRHEGRNLVRVLFFIIELIFMKIGRIFYEGLLHGFFMYPLI